MTEYEDLGEELKWQHDNGNDNRNNTSTSSDSDI